MDPISPADRLVALLRQRLKEGTAVRRARVQSNSTSGGRSAVGALQALVATGEVEERQIFRALIQELLVDQLSDNLASDANFQSVVDRVLDALMDDPAGANLLKAGVRALSAG